MNTLSILTITNIVVGIISIVAGVLVLVHRRNFTLHKGIALLLFSLGTSAIASAGISQSNWGGWFTIFYFSRAFWPIFLFTFAEYILGIRYHIIIKLVVLSLTWILGVSSWFIHSTAPAWYQLSIGFFPTITMVLILVHIVHRFTVAKEWILKKYLLVFGFTVAIPCALEMVGLFSNSIIQQWTQAILTFLIVNGVILIITSGGHSRLHQKLGKLLFILSFGLMVGIAFKLCDPTITVNQQVTLFVISTGILSLHYTIIETSRNLKEISSVKLISRLLALNLHDVHIFFEQLKGWEEVTGLHPVKASEVQSNLNQLTSLFKKTGRIIHKFQISALASASVFDASLQPGVEAAEYYFKKLECDSLVQLSAQGDFVAVQYAAGLNPALYSQELAIMGKIIFSANLSLNGNSHGHS